MIKKSVISLISYDAEYLPKSIRSYYNYVDEIVLGLDENRTSWSGNKFTFDEEKLFKELGEIDGDNKIYQLSQTFIIGGDSIYKLALQELDICRLYATEVYQNNQEYDTFYPKINGKNENGVTNPKFEIVSCSDFQLENELYYRFIEYINLISKCLTL